MHISRTANSAATVEKTGTEEQLFYSKSNPDYFYSKQAMVSNDAVAVDIEWNRMKIEIVVS